MTAGLYHHLPSCFCSTCRDPEGNQHPVLCSGILTIGESEKDKAAPPRVPLPRSLSYRADIPILPWMISDGGSLDVDNCPDCWERNAHLERYAFACMVLKGGRVLDFGCGVGYGSEMLARAGNVVIGADTSEPALLLAQARRGEWVAEFVRPCETGGYFFATVAFEVIEHLEDPQLFLDSVAFYSKHLVISTPVVPTVDNNPFHKHDFTPAQFRAMIEKRFRIVTEWHQIRPFRKEPTYAVIHAETLSQLYKRQPVLR